jgi:hypothetical protein
MPTSGATTSEILAEIERQNGNSRPTSATSAKASRLTPTSALLHSNKREQAHAAAVDTHADARYSQGDMANNKKSVNKTAWIRDQPAQMRAKEVVEKAKSAGIALSTQQVYTARSTAAKAPARTAPRPNNPPPPSAAQPRGAGTEFTEFRRMVVKVGVLRAEEMLAQVKREFGL